MVFSLLNKMFTLNRTKKMGAADLQIFQRKRFETLISYAFDHSPFYADYYHKHGIRKEHVKSLKITDLPFTNKQILMDNFDRVVCDPRLKLDEIQKYVTWPENLWKLYPGDYTVLYSSGTSGKIGYYAYSKDEWEYTPAVTASRMESPFSHFIKRGKMLGFVAADGNYGGISLLNSIPDFLYDKLIIPIDTPAAELIEKINSFPGAEILSGYAAGIFQIAKLQLAGKINQHPNLITTSAEMLTPLMRGVIREAFGINPRDFYAASESLCIGGECEFSSGIHLFSDCHIFELVDENKRPVPEGTVGRLVLTNLYRKIQPLIRYEINDTMSINPAPCACGSPFPRIKSFEGRESVVLEFSIDGKRGFIHHSLLKELAVPGLQNIQYIQNSPESLLVYAVITGNQQEVKNNISKKMDLILKSGGLDFVQYSITLVDDIPLNPKTHKLETVVCYKPVPAVK